MKLSRTDLINAGSTLVVLAISLLIFTQMSNDQAKRFDIQWGYQFMLIPFLGAVGLWFWNARDYWKRLLSKLPSRNSMIVAGVVLIFLSAFTLTNIHRQHRVLSDENSWTAMALQMHYNQSGGVCNQGYWVDSKLHCTDEVNNFKGKSLSMIQSALFWILPSNRDTALAVNFPLYLASLVLFFFAVYRFLDNSWLALTAMTFLGAMPIYMMQAQAASTEVLYVFLFTLLMLFYALVPPAEVRWKHVLLNIAILGLFSGTRQETVFCFIPFTIYYHRFLREKAWHLPLFTGLVILASWPAINTMAAYRGYDFQGGQHAAQSFENLRYNLQSNISIMMKPGIEAGILKNPFYSAFSALWLGGTLWLLLRMVASRKFVWGGILMILFHLQSFVILYNVSGTFEIDINQRYVLIALPTFALIMALGLFDFLNTAPAATNPLRRYALQITVALALGLSGYLTLSHTADFKGNMLYFKNKLLSEEDFLNTELKKLPPNSIFIYSRPWQMLCSGFNAFSENTLLGWSDQEYAKWKQFSNGNIYLVRGQDGFGTVDKNSRVVGFKTTEPIERILTEYATVTILTNARDFGYPLSVTHLKNRKGRSRFAEALVVQSSANEMLPGIPFHIGIRRNFPEVLPYTWQLDGTEQKGGLLEKDSTALAIDPSAVTPGMHHFDIQFFAPENDTIRIAQDFFVYGGTAIQLQAMKPIRQYQEWSTPQAGKSVDGNTMKVNRRSFLFGYGSHANSSIAFRLNGQYLRFRTLVGLDDESACGDGAQWVIRGDQKELWVSPKLNALMLDSANVDVKGVQVLELEIRRLENNFCDHGNWLNPWLE